MQKLWFFVIYKRIWISWQIQFLKIFPSLFNVPESIEFAWLRALVHCMLCISALRMSLQPSAAQCTYLEVLDVCDLFNVFNSHHISKVYAHKMQSVYLVLVNLIKQTSLFPLRYYSTQVRTISATWSCNNWVVWTYN